MTEDDWDKGKQKFDPENKRAESPNALFNASREHV